jgi:hypothetical protein
MMDLWSNSLRRGPRQNGLGAGNGLAGNWREAKVENIREGVKGTGYGAVQVAVVNLDNHQAPTRSQHYTASKMLAR